MEKLSDKSCHSKYCDCPKHYQEKDVKEALKEFIDKASNNTGEEFKLKLKAKEIFGKELVD